jgi:hypothetical protein
MKAPPATDRPLRVVYLAGSGHTGSTLLALLMDSHPAIVSVGEIAVKPRIRRRGDAAVQHCSCGATIADCAFWQRIFAAVQAQGLRFGVDEWTNDYRLEHPLAHRLLTRDSSFAFVRAFQAWCAHHLPIYNRRVENTGRVNVAFIRAVLQATAADVFFDTSKVSARLARLLERPELDVRVVRLVRDVRGYGASAKRRGLSVEDAASSWKKDQEAISAVTVAVAPERTLLLKYEDLCDSPGEVMRQLYRFCGVEEIHPITSTRSDEHHVLGNNMRRDGTITVRLDERWRSKLRAEEQRQILAIAGPLNRALGYPS